jgi:hypothetical protein
MTNIVLLSTALFTNKSEFATWKGGPSWIQGDRKIVQEFRLGYVSSGAVYWTETNKDGSIHKFASNATPIEVTVVTTYQTYGALIHDGTNWTFQKKEDRK